MVIEQEEMEHYSSCCTDAILDAMKNTYAEIMIQESNGSIPVVLFTSNYPNSPKVHQGLDSVIEESELTIGKEIFRIVFGEKPDFAAVVVDYWFRPAPDNPVLQELTKEMIRTFGIDTDPMKEEVIMVVAANRKRFGMYRTNTHDENKQPLKELGEWKQMDPYKLAGEPGPILIAVPSAYRMIQAEEQLHEKD